MAQRETPVLQAVRAVLAAHGPTWRNSTGFDHQKKITYGLGIGGADLITIVPVLITPDMVGLTIGRFGGVEVKTPDGRLSPEQRIWREGVLRAGGAYHVARSAEDAARALQQTRVLDRARSGT